MPNLCIVDDCERALAYRSSGLCNMHEYRMKANGTTDYVGRKRGKCNVEGCDNPHSAKGYCSIHYGRIKNHGSTESKLNRNHTGGCSIDKCEQPYYGNDLCRVHYMRVYTTGTPYRLCEICKVAELDNPRVFRCEKVACQIVGARQHPSGYMYTGRGDKVHRLVMEEALGRKLTATENVHHINGDRQDNRLENLELWNTSQPSGQRIEDKVQWAKELLALYQPQALSDFDYEGSY